MRSSTFAETVIEAANMWGRNAPVIVDKIIEKVCPKSVAATNEEGVFGMLRNGMKQAVTAILKGARSTATIDFSEIFDEFPMAKDLKSTAYYVAEDEEEVPLADLIDDPERLLSAAHFMQQKGMECLAEARRLFALYEAVMAKRRPPPPHPSGPEMHP